MLKTIITLFTLQTLFTLNSFTQWVQVSNGMGNLNVSSLASGGNNIFAGTYASGVYLSTNNGTNWTQTSLTNSVSSLAVNGNYIFAGGYDGVFVSTDNGTNWTHTSLNNEYVYSLAVNGNNVFAGTEFRVYLSTNSGTTWTQTSLNRTVRSFVFNGNNVFAGCAGAMPDGVYLSTNNGTSWTQTSLNNRYVTSLAVKGDTIFAGTSANQGVYLSTNNGTNWTQTSLNNRSVSSLAVNGNNIFAGCFSGGVYVSNDNGANWTPRNEGLGNLSVQALSISNNFIFAGTDGNSVYRRPLDQLVGIQPISGQLPSHFALEQNYPNPFNPTTKIKFDVPSVGQTFLSVYDVLGKEVATLVNEQLNAGTYEVDWDASNYPSGVYMYQLIAGDPSAPLRMTKKMILVK